MVDENGKVNWQGRYVPGQGAAAVPRSAPEARLVRIYTPSGELLREYGLEVNRYDVRVASAAVSVERFFQLSLLGLVASGYLAVAGSGYLDAPRSC